ncbi:helix-turn-helix domain-containing protein [Desulfotalea psychrophila]|uniref:HTH cro/C1-type domain-containing protein n=1 Tax=Desulfotalea psychrophila (strain LSv54 / DSM 12343) TaxID=177439 RepID=Q6AIL6_DESPS|nr:helix-turn-helix transcriptional regulator [Desulfotalea psychrophila]CAG37814.1 hypothetical protein DP3085 [Desulfotalea psychrophila LSv54]
MSEAQTQDETLGDVLRKTRINRGLSVEEISGSTKISTKTIRAMEEDDYEQLPSPAFTHGFYGLYAKKLGLGAEEIQGQYKRESKQQTGKQLPPQHLAKDIGAMAERPLIPLFSIFGFSLLLLLFVFVIFSWFFSWNPADFLSKQLRSLDESPIVQIDRATPTHPLLDKLAEPKELSYSKPLSLHSTINTFPVQYKTENSSINFVSQGFFS